MASVTTVVWKLWRLSF